MDTAREPLVTESHTEKPFHVRLLGQSRRALVISVMCSTALFLFAPTARNLRPGQDGKPTAELATDRPGQCSETGPSPCIRKAVHGKYIGDSSKDHFARTDENLAFFDTFTETEVDSSVWTPTKSMWGDGNNCFEYYTDSSANLYINQTDHTLRLKPGLLEQMGTLMTDAGPQPAKDAMLGTCEPYPACATFNVPGCKGDGCQKVAGGGNILNPATSARVTTEETFAFTYGRVEIEMRMPAGDWLWPAAWLYVPHLDYGAWPISGEIDLLETHANAKGYLKHGKPAGRERFATTLHYMGNTWWAAQGTAVADADRVDWSTDFFTLGLYWDQREMYTYLLDPRTGKEQVLYNVSGLDRRGVHAFFDAPLGAEFNKPTEDWQVSQTTPVDTDPATEPYHDGPSNAPFDKPFYIILNLAVGGAQSGCPNPDYWGSDAIWCRCWPNCTVPPQTEFYNRKSEWYPSWEEAERRDRLAMAIKSVKVWQ